MPPHLNGNAYERQNWCVANVSVDGQAQHLCAAWKYIISYASEVRAWPSLQ